VQQHNFTPFQTHQQNNSPPHTLRQMWHLCTNVYDMQQGVRWPNQPEPKATLQAAHLLHQK